ncbi:MarR family transcriptional regulator [Nocardioides marinquilinus]|uniref:MarR family transcriptional regulator n=1 Tax=Nocardioides marinquilinus TaxID=1210400 RepID=A0ABP9PGX0_9ACTN
MSSAPWSRDRNRIGAAMLLLGDRVAAAGAEATGLRGGAPAALVSLLGWADGHHLDALAGGLGLSHSRTVRIVDGLERDGLVERVADTVDGRRALVVLTDEGRRRAEAAVAARSVVLDDVLAVLDDDQRRAVAAAAERVLLDQAVDRRTARHICRLCDVVACGHRDGDCPATRGADRREALPPTEGESR